MSAIDDWFEKEQLHFAAAAGDLLRVEKLIRSGYPTNTFDDISKTPLHYAVAGNHYEIVECLIRNGADVNANEKAKIGNSPLSDALDEITLRMVKLLIDYGADPTIKGWMQLTAIDRAEQRAKRENSGGDGVAIYEFLKKAAAGNSLGK